MSNLTGINESTVRSVVEEVLRKLNGESAAPAAGSATTECGCGGQRATNSGSGADGVFSCGKEASAAAHEAFLALQQLGMAGRQKVVDIVKTLCTDKQEEWGRLEFEETKIGRLEHKIDKLRGIKNIPGTEWLSPYGMSGDHGIAMEEQTPFGVIGAITPVTHSIPTLSCNIINMVAAGNAVVFNAHPGGARCAAESVRVYNRAFRRELGIDNLCTIVEHPTLESFQAIAQSPEVRLLCVTGGPGVVAAAMKSGKRAICAGPGNPPVVVDETARLDRAARDIIIGGAYDNNLLCIGEKEVFVVDKVYREFIAAFKAAGAYPINDTQLEALTRECFAQKDGHWMLNRDVVGLDAPVLAEHGGVRPPADCKLLFAETSADHLFVVEEQMTPMIPIVRVRDVEEGIERSKVAEHGYKHSSMIHSLNVENMTAMARALDSTLFVKNGPCVAGLGSGGEGYSSFSIATTTGEGITTPKTFTRTRRCVMVDNLRIW
ncbi:MAG: aldehyde dehydrogenase family protein [Opitutales bacterium]